MCLEGRTTLTQYRGTDCLAITRRQYRVVGNCKKYDAQKIMTYKYYEGKEGVIVRRGTPSGSMYA